MTNDTPADLPPRPARGLVARQRAVRPTRRQIDEEILDQAAALFARHGVAQTSVQRIADATGYSKTGLLHRFPSKEAIVDAVRGQCLAGVTDVIADMADQPAGPARDRHAIELLLAMALRRPGSVALLLASLAAPDDEDTQWIHGSGRTLLLQAFGADERDRLRLVRIVASLGALGVGVVGLPADADTAMLAELVDACYDALGH